MLRVKRNSAALCRGAWLNPIVFPLQIKDLVPAVVATVAGAEASDTDELASGGQHLSKNLLVDSVVNDDVLDGAFPFADQGEAAHDSGAGVALAVGVEVQPFVLDVVDGDWQG